MANVVEWECVVQSVYLETKQFFHDRQPIICMVLLEHSNNIRRI